MIIKKSKNHKKKEAIVRSVEREAVMAACVSNI